MGRNMKRTGILLACLIPLSFTSSPAAEVSERLQRALQATPQGTPLHVWVYLTDKGAARLRQVPIR